MSDPGTELLRRLFERALALPAAARPPFLRQKCAGDADLERRLQAMLELAGGASPPPAPSPPASSSSTVLRPSPAEAEAEVREGPGSTIGPYQLLQQIGEGGFGIVYLAEQMQPVVRRVALKIIKVGMDTRQVVARFEQERQALALMDHPNIARVIDAGATATGRPYFVMELVKGEPITTWCDQNKAAIAERLELFVQVCHAVQHAHGKGIIHRDLKPSNILVGAHDGRPCVKIIDFGIAKATNARLTDKTLFTEQRQVIGTLAYMSPEQADGQLDIDTRADVYSLGVVLYELLTGTTPFAAPTTDAVAYGELQRLIREADPPRPSTRLGQSTTTLPGIAAHRRVDPRRLGSLLRGDLDHVVMKALDKDRARRYATANDLAADVHRFAAGQPVTAMPPSTFYLLRKFTRRNLPLVVAAGIVALTLIGGLVAVTWQVRVAQDERDLAHAAREAEAAARAKADRLAAAEAEARAAEAQARAAADAAARTATEQRDAAATSARTASATNQFLLDMLGATNVRNLGPDAKVAQVLEQAAASVGSAFGEQPNVAHAIRQALARSWLSIGVLDRANEQLVRVLDLARTTYGEQSIEYAGNLADQAEYLRQRGDTVGAEAAARRAAAIAAAVQPDGQEVSWLRLAHANKLVELGQLDEAEAMLRDSLARLSRLIGREHVRTLVAINSLAVLLHTRGRLDEAEELYREAATVGERVHGPEHSDTLTARWNLARMRGSRGDRAGAAAMMESIWPAFRRVFGAESARAADAAFALGDFRHAQGRFQDAVVLLEDCIAIRRRVEGEVSAGVASAQGVLGLCLTRLEQHERAIAAYRAAAATCNTLFGGEAEATLRARLGLANALVAAQQVDEGERLLSELLAVLPSALGEDHPATVIATNSYAVFLLGRWRTAEAVPYLEQAWASGVRAEGAEAPNTLITRCNLAHAKVTLGHADGEAIAREVLAGFLRAVGSDHPNVASARRILAEALLARGEPVEAERELRAALASRRASGGDAAADSAEENLMLARVLLATGRGADAETLLQGVAGRLEQARGAEDRRLAAARIELAHCLAARRAFAEAEPLFADNHASLVADRPAAHPAVVRAIRYQAEFWAAWHEAAPDPSRAARAAEWQARIGR